MKTFPFLSSSSGSGLPGQGAILLLLLTSTAALAQTPSEPTQPVPADAKRTILDLKYQIQDLPPKTVLIWRS